MQTMIANTELDKKEKKIGKLQEIVKEADNRLVELKENMETKDFLEKKQRVLSVENQKLRKDFRKLEALLEEKEKWTCAQCGGVISLHDRACSECGDEL